MTARAGDGVPLSGIGAELVRLWRDQMRYNEAIKAIRAGEVVRWPEVYAIGVHEEVTEVLRAAKWKYHKPGQREAVDRDLLADELADLTKYVISLWQEYDFNVPDMLQAVGIKTRRLEAGLTNDWFPPEGVNVLVTDLDGTGADFRAGFASGAGFPDHVRSLAMDLDNGLGWDSYERAKVAWEGSGGYGRLPAYEDWVELLRGEAGKQTHIMVVTARPADTIHRVWSDTEKWLKDRGVGYKTLLMGRDERLVQLLRLSGRRNRVLLLEDDPTLALRAAGAGLKVWMRSQPYNMTVRHENITPWIVFPGMVNWERLYEAE